MKSSTLFTIGIALANAALPVGMAINPDEDLYYRGNKVGQPCRDTSDCLDKGEKCSFQIGRCIQAAEPLRATESKALLETSCNATSDCVAGFEVCDTEAHKCLNADVPFGYECKISEQCAQGYSAQMCCTSGTCNACAGVVGAACSSKSDCDSGLECISRDSRQSTKACTPTDGSDKSPCNTNADCRDGLSCYKKEIDSIKVCNAKTGTLGSACDSSLECESHLVCNVDGTCAHYESSTCLRYAASCLFQPNSCCNGLKCTTGYHAFDRTCAPA